MFNFEEEVKLDEYLAQKYETSLKGINLEEYVIGRLLGFGKSAAVFLASNESGENVAIKVFDNEIIERYGSESQEERIRHEISLKGHKINNLVQIHGGGSFISEGTKYFYIIMELVTGVNLKEYIKINHAQSFDFAVKIFMTLYMVSEELLKLNIAHRDIKPENIMINSNEIILMDLGVLKIINEPSTTDLNEHKPFIGTLRYAPPEFLMRKEENTQDAWRAINLYQIAGVLHDVIMGQELFFQYSEPYGRLVLAIQNEMPAIKRVDFNPKFCQLIRNMLVKDWKTRLLLFKTADIDKAIKSDFIQPNIKQSVENIRKLTMEHQEKILQIETKRKEEREKTTQNQRIFELLKNDINRIMNNIQKQEIFNDVDLLELVGDRNDRNQFTLLYEIKGELKQGYAGSIFINFYLRINCDTVILLKANGLVAGTSFFVHDRQEKAQKIINELSKSAYFDLFNGVYDSDCIAEIIESTLYNGISEAIRIMAPQVKSELEFQEKIAGRSGVFSNVTIRTKNTLLRLK